LIAVQLEAQNGQYSTDHSILMLIQALSREERGLLRSQLRLGEERVQPQRVDLNRFSGVICLDIDPLGYQQQMRDEWM
jgi:hypothetical protein